MSEAPAVLHPCFVDGLPRKGIFFYSVGALIFMIKFVFFCELNVYRVVGGKQQTTNNIEFQYNTFKSSYF